MEGARMNVTIDELAKRAGEEYDNAPMLSVRHEKRRVWTGKRYVYRMVEITDVGRRAAVTPSKLPLVEQVTRGPGLPSREGHAIDKILDFIDDHGAHTINELVSCLSMPYSTIRTALHKSDGVSCCDIDARWHLTDIPYEPDFIPAWKLIADYLEEYGASMIVEIMAKTELSKSAVASALRSHPERFEIVGTHSTRARIWDLRHESI
jgi:hypothetical protein